MEDKEKIIIDGVDVSQCEFYIYYSSDRYPHRCGMHKDMFGMPACCDVADCCKDCYYKQLQKEKFENLNNRQMIESAENLIYENSELIKNLKEKEQECESLKEEIEVLKDNFDTATRDCNELIEELKQECEELKKEIINKNEKIKELRFSVSDLTNRLCYLNAEKSFRIVDLEQTLKEIEGLISDDEFIRCPINDDVNCNYFTRNKILDIINKAKEK